MQKMTADIGSRRWVVAEGFIPGGGIEGDRSLESHETYCVLNAGSQDALLKITLFFTNRPSVGPYRVTVPAARTLHLRTNDLDDPEPVPRDTDYAAVIQSDRPVVIQHTRLDSRAERIALMTTMAYAVS